MPKLEDIARLKFPVEMTPFLWRILREQHKDSQPTFPHFDIFPLHVAAEGVRLAVINTDIYAFTTLEEVELIREMGGTEVRYSWVRKGEYNRLLEIYDLMTLGRRVRDQALTEEQPEEDKPQMAQIMLEKHCLDSD